jgi:hypothetical protein
VPFKILRRGGDIAAIAARERDIFVRRRHVPFQIIRPSRRVLALFTRQKTTVIRRRLVNGFLVPAQVCRVRGDIIARGAGDYQVGAVSGLMNSGLWIRIRVTLSYWIRIRIQEGKNDPQIKKK